RVNPDACVGCTICQQMCRIDALYRESAEKEPAHS
ncbi:MAG: 4Fe-4S binding protein, partial [Planctomycetes bacterium]|nr:4Fe-4S binding protein [Planctomycetota bacterium]